MRKFYYLKPNIQYSFTTFFAILSAMEIVLFGLLLYIVENLNIHRSYDVMLYIRFSIVLIIILLFSGFNFWLGMRLSHRIVGPMIQIQRVLERAIKNDYSSRIHLRNNDYLYEIADKLNLLLEKLDQKSKKLQQDSNEE